MKLEASGQMDVGAKKNKRNNFVLHSVISEVQESETGCFNLLLLCNTACNEPTKPNESAVNKFFFLISFTI